MRGASRPALYALRPALFILLAKNPEKRSVVLSRLSHPLILLAHFRVEAEMNRAALAAATLKEAMNSIWGWTEAVEARRNFVASTVLCISLIR